MGLPYGEEIVIVGRNMWTQCTSVTGIRTDGHMAKTAQRIASRGKNEELDGQAGRRRD